MKQKLIITLIFILVNTININSQTTIDIVRASNYYSKALSNYQNGSYSKALSNLSESEKNLKGKTNKDLEFLKIMTNYRLKDFGKAYKLLTTYFEKGYNGKTQYYKNIKTYKQKNNIVYDEILTSIFIELEEKYGVVKNTSTDDVVAAIIKRIRSNKKNISNFLDYSTSREEKIYLFKWKSEIVQKGLTRYGTGKVSRTYLTLERGNINYKEKYITYTNDSYEGCVSGNCCVKLYFSENNSVDKYSYNYEYRFKNSELKSLSCRTFSYYAKGYKSIYSTSAGSFIKNNRQSIARSESLKNIKRHKFYSNKSKSYSITFTDNEKLILEQPGNLEKLKIALRKNKLL